MVSVQLPLLTSLGILGRMTEPLHACFIPYRGGKGGLTDQVTSGTGFLTCNTSDILDPITLCSGGHPEHGGMFSSTLDLYSLDVCNTRPPLPPSCDNQRCLQTFPNVTWAAKLFLVDNRWCRKCCEEKRGEAYLRESVSTQTRTWETWQ